MAERAIAARGLNTRLWLAGGWLFAALLLAIFAPLVAPHDPLAQDLLLERLPPFFQRGAEPGYWLGTDSLGRDLLSRLIYGARIAFVVAFAGQCGTRTRAGTAILAVVADIGGIAGEKKEAEEWEQTGARHGRSFRSTSRARSRAFVTPRHVHAHRVMHTALRANVDPCSRVASSSSPRGPKDGNGGGAPPSVSIAR